MAVYYFGKNSSSNHNLRQVKEKTSSGAFLVNDIAIHFLAADLPFGGVGASGYGRCHGKVGFDQCSNTKSVMLKTPVNLWPFTVIHPPYTPENQKIMRLLMTTSPSRSMASTALSNRLTKTCSRSCRSAYTMPSAASRLRVTRKRRTMP